ncbi:MAG: FG-GAP repeat protein [Bacteroidales bacterium]|nr:FG-GAP repeat protein [Bacteroidales bacterium]
MIDPQTQAVLFDLNPFETTFTGGVFVSSGDLLGLGSPQVIVSPDQGGGPRVQIRDGQTGAVLMDFFGIDDPNFRGGVQTAIADVTGDHIPDLIVAAGMGGGPRVTVYDGAALREQRLQVVADLFVFEETLRNGVSVTAGDVNGDGYADLIVGGGPGSGPRVLALSGHDLTLGVSQPTVLANFFAGDLNSRSGIRLTVKDLDGDAYADLLTAPGPGGGTQVTAYAGKDISPDGTPPELFHYDGDADSFDGIFIG